jgi:hypothetical protein
MPDGGKRKTGKSAMADLKRWQKEHSIAGRLSSRHDDTRSPWVGHPETLEYMENPIVQALVFQSPGEMAQGATPLQKTALDLMASLVGGGMVFGVGKRILARDALENAVQTGRTLRNPGRSIFPGPRPRGLIAESVESPRSWIAQRQAVAGWDPNWPFVPQDLRNPAFVEAIKADLTLSAGELQKILEFLPGGRKDRILTGIGNL